MVHMMNQPMWNDIYTPHHIINLNYSGCKKVMKINSPVLPLLKYDQRVKACRFGYGGYTILLLLWWWLCCRLRSCSWSWGRERTRALRRSGWLYYRSACSCSSARRGACGWSCDYCLLYWWGGRLAWKWGLTWWLTTYWTRSSHWLLHHSTHNACWHITYN
jgi:hypothetical protein